jgi:hypothetical protein
VISAIQSEREKEREREREREREKRVKAMGMPSQGWPGEVSTIHQLKFKQAKTKTTAPKETWHSIPFQK